MLQKLSAAWHLCLDDALAGAEKHLNKLDRLCGVPNVTGHHDGETWPYDGKTWPVEVRRLFAAISLA